MTTAREFAAFAIALGALIALFLGQSLFGGKVLSPADVLFVAASFRDVKGSDYEPANRLLTDPVLQFQPWLEFNRAMLRRGRLPLWNDRAGCGAPHLADSQSAVFDPFNVIAYLGGSFAWVAAARLWVAGMGAFVLARSWDFAPWGRWFAGLTFALSGFVVVWLLYPVTAAAVWMPWLFWATDRVFEKPESRSLGLVGVVVGCLFLAGHVQTSAHVLLAAGSYTVWRVVRPIGDLRPGRIHPPPQPSPTRGEGDINSLPPCGGGLGWGVGHSPSPEKRDCEPFPDPRIPALTSWSVGVVLGLSIAAISIVPFWVYLGKSPVWADRGRERPSPFEVTRPRVLDAVCTAVPYAFGSQRRGHPNLARALGVHNLNESAGGFAGLATLIWLAPQAWRRGNRGRVGFLSALAGFGFLGAFGFPPVVNLLRAIPVLDVMDQRRLTLWVSFGLVMLGGMGLDRLAMPWPRFVSRTWFSILVVTAGLLGLASFGVSKAEPWLRSRAERHYAKAAESTEGADASIYQRRADRQVRQTLDHVPRQLLLTAAELAALAALAELACRDVIAWSSARSAVLGLTVVELFGFGYGLNPAIDPADDRPVTAVISRLRAEVGTAGRVLGLGEELPPNVAMRYGLSDIRNYDSVELTRNLDAFEPLYEPETRGRTSRRAITWAGVMRAKDRLREGSVRAVVAAPPPPDSLGARSEKVGAVWVARLDAEPLAATTDHDMPTFLQFDHGIVDVLIACRGETTLVVRQTFDPGWRAEVDDRPALISPYLGTFQGVQMGRGPHRVRLVYDPAEVRAAVAVSLSAAALAVLGLSGFRPRGMGRFRGKGLGAFRAPGVESGDDSHRTG